MHFSRLSSLFTTLLAVSTTNALNILITNDDGFGTSLIREMYTAVKAFGHTAIIVASVDNESGQGGRVVFSSSSTLQVDTEFGIVKKGAPAVGTDPNDRNIWYYNGTPSACVQVALDYIIPNNYSGFYPDLVMSGPNFGLNLGPFLYTLSGTIGAAYTAVERGIPAIAFSTGLSVQTPYFNVSSPTAAGLLDPATISGRLCASLAQSLITAAAGKRILPYGYGINVNIPLISSAKDSSCLNPPFILTRFTGGAYVDGAGYNSTTGLFSFTNIISNGTNTCINGDCSLPGEQTILNSGCQSSVSVFTVDYDAPTCNGAPTPRSLVTSLVQNANSTSLVGGLNGTTGIFGNATTTTSANASASATASSTASSSPVFTGAAETLRVGSGAAAVLVAAFMVMM